MLPSCVLTAAVRGVKRVLAAWNDCEALPMPAEARLTASIAPRAGLIEAAGPRSNGGMVESAASRVEKEVFASLWGATDNVRALERVKKGLR